jgi:heme-degrading monooxygenase HmoA
LFARLTTYELEEGRASESIAAFEPAIERIRMLDGLVDAFYLVERDGRRAVTVTIWDSVESMERSRVAASNARTEAAREAGAEVTSTSEFEIGIHASGERANLGGDRLDTNVSAMGGNPSGRSFFS